MKPTYNKYKNSDFIYTNQITDDWEYIKFKYLFEERKTKGFPNEPLLVASQDKGVVLKDSYGRRTTTATKDLHLLKLVNKKDFVISLRSFEGGIEISYERGIISPAYTVFFPKNKVNNYYYKHLFKSHSFIALLKTCVTGIREGQNIDYNIIKDEYIPIPPIEIQNRIVAYLDEKEKQIKQFIKKKKELINSLKNKKINIFNETIHKGLNSNYKTVKTDIGYTLYHPENWNKKPLKYVVKHISENTSQYRKGEYYLPLENIVSYFGEHTYQNEDVYFESNVKRFKKNDVLFSKLRPYLTKSVVAQVDGLCVGEILVFRPRQEINPEFLNYILLSQRFIDFVNSSSYGTKMPRASWDLIGRVEISYPKDLELQKEIVLKIKNKLNNIDKTIEKTTEEIKLAEDLLKSQIEQVVTGKIQVPNTFNDYIGIAAEPATTYKTL